MASEGQPSWVTDLTPAQRMALDHTKYHATVIGHVPEDGEASKLTILPEQDVHGSNGESIFETKIQSPNAHKLVFKPDVATKSPVLPLDTQSEEAFPSLGVSKPATLSGTSQWGPATTMKGKANGLANGSLATSAPRPLIRAGAQASARPVVQLPHTHEESYPLLRSSVKTGMKKSLAETLSDITRGTGVKLEARQGLNEKAEPITRLVATGSSDKAVRNILRAAVLEIGKRDTIKVQVPSSLKAQLIGKGGTKIKEIQNRSGAKIHLPPSSGIRPPGASDDDEQIEATVEGDPIALATALQEIHAVIGQNPSTVSLTLQGIPPELFPFLNQQFGSPPNDPVKINIPSYYTWKADPPASQSCDFIPQEGSYILLSGPTDVARQKRSELEAFATELQQRLIAREIFGIERERHQFILGPSGLTLEEFVSETDCSIILPPADDNSETIFIVGSADKLEQAKEKAMDLAGAMVNNPIDISRIYQGSREGQGDYLRNLTRYMRHSRTLEAITTQHNAQVSFPSNPTQPWTLWTRDSRSGVRARTDVLHTISCYPQTRFRTVNIHPFYQRDLERQYAGHLRNKQGVCLVVPDPNEESAQVLLVHESPSIAAEHVLSQRRPTSDEALQSVQTLLEAEKYLMQAIGEQEIIVDRTIEVPTKYREKVFRFSQRQASKLRYPVKYHGLAESSRRQAANLSVLIQGPSGAVNEAAEQLLAYIAEQLRDETERSFSTSCSFPRAHRGRLIGKDGETIKRVRDDFDVEINFRADDDKVEIKGPPAKAEAAKAYVISMARKIEDETTHTLLIPSRFHGELIGKGGSQIQKYQDRYGVQVFFPFAQVDRPAETAISRRRIAQGPDEVIIKGSKKGADACKEDLWAMYSLAQERSFSATISVAQAQVPSLIGREGSEANILRSETGADVEFPKQGGTSDASGRCAIVIRGSKDSVQKARKVLEEKVKAYDQTVTEVLQIDKKHYRTLIGSNGENLRQMVAAAGGDASQSSRIVQIPKELSSEQTVRLIASKDVVHKLTTSIKAFVEMQNSRTSEFFEVPPERHGALIGTRGTVKKSIETDCNVSLLIPKESVPSPARSQVMILGQPTDIARAKDRIATILRQGGVEVTVQVPVRLHHVVADGGKMFRTIKRDMNVTVDHNKQKPPTTPLRSANGTRAGTLPLITDDTTSGGQLSAIDVAKTLVWDVVANSNSGDVEDHTIPWVLKGNPDNVDKAKLMLEAAVDAARHHVTGYLILPDPRSTHAHVVGPGGASIRSIRETTGCNPRIPPLGEVGAIEISGNRENVERTKELIVEAVTKGLKKKSRESREAL